MPSTATLVPNPWMILPFGLLLAAIALGPLWFSGWWGRNYARVAFGLGAVTLLYYLAGLKAWSRVGHTATEYLSFIVLIGALFVVSGGIHITVKGEATPRANCAFLLIGALLANLLGTTGASMLLIRPWLRLNAYRATAHHVVFFIFIVANVGGCLSPIGDPPLFLGYLKGIPFFWVVRHCWPMWAVGVGTLLVMFYFIDRRNYLRAPAAVRAELAEPADEWRFGGLANLGFLALILAAVFVQKPPLVRELIMVLAATASYLTTKPEIHEANHFNFHPIREVAILFVGIFATMMPALDWLETHAGNFGAPKVALYYWGSGTLSSVLDNAPTYLSFLSAALGALVPPDVVDQVSAIVRQPGAGGAIAAHLPLPVLQTMAALHECFPAALASGTATREQIGIACLLGNPALNPFIVAISVGSVFFGANTYIGNGPNFMVKAIADQKRVHAPDFIAYVLKFTLPFMLPMLVLVWWLFFRG